MGLCSGAEREFACTGEAEPRGSSCVLYDTYNTFCTIHIRNIGRYEWGLLVLRHRGWWTPRSLVVNSNIPYTHRGWWTPRSLHSQIPYTLTVHSQGGKNSNIPYTLTASKIPGGELQYPLHSHSPFPRGKPGVSLRAVSSKSAWTGNLTLSQSIYPSLLSETRTSTIPSRPRLRPLDVDRCRSDLEFHWRVTGVNSGCANR